MLITIPIRFFTEGFTLDRFLFERSPYLDVDGKLVPALCALGILFNLLAFAFYLHPDMRSLSTLFLSANLLTDSVFLVTLMLTSAVTPWLHQDWQAGRQEHFWSTLHALQATYLGAYPVLHITKLLSQLYTLAMILEQCTAFLRPAALTEYANGDKGIKVVITLLNVTILVHIISFFKFVRDDIVVVQRMPDNSTLRTPAKRVCLSVIYRSEQYESYEKYTYFACFECLPWLMTFCCFLLCIYAYRRHKAEMSALSSQDLRLVRTFKSGRSVRVVLSVTGAFLALQLASHVLYVKCIPFLAYDPFAVNCYLTPTDFRYLSVPLHFNQAYRFINLTAASIKPWLCLVASSENRHVLGHCLRRRGRRIRKVARKVFIIIDFRRPTPPEEGDSVSTINTSVEMSEGPPRGGMPGGSAAPYHDGTSYTTQYTSEYGSTSGVHS